MTKEKFKKDAEILTVRQMAAKYNASIATIRRKAKELGIELIQEKKGRPSKFNF